MNQQNFYQQQGYGGQQSQQGMQSHLQEQDLAHLILSELKRVSREYTTAVLEANNMQTRQTFQFLLQKTLHDQGNLYELMQQTVGYGEIPTATQQDIQKELQKQSQSATQLYGFVQQNKFGSLGGQNQMQNQMQNQPQNQTFAFNQQPQGMGQQQSFQPSQSQSNSPLFPNGNYGPSSPINYTSSQVPSGAKSNLTASEPSASASNETSTEKANSGQSTNEGSKYSF